MFLCFGGQGQDLGGSFVRHIAPSKILAVSLKVLIQICNGLTTGQLCSFLVFAWAAWAIAIGLVSASPAYNMPRTTRLTTKTQSMVQTAFWILTFGFLYFSIVDGLYFQVAHFTTFQISLTLTLETLAMVGDHSIKVQGDVTCDG